MQKMLRNKNIFAPETVDKKFREIIRIKLFH